MSRSKRDRNGIVADTRVSTDRRMPNAPYSLAGGFPDRLHVRLRYAENTLYNSAVSQTQVWSGNSVYDPNVTGSGSQPVDFDDLAAMYNRYVVLGSTIEVDFVNLGSAVTSGTVIFIVAPRHATTAIGTGVPGAICAPYAKYIVSGSLGSTNPKSDRKSLSMRTGRFLGMTDSELIANNSSLTNASPAHEWYWHTSILALDGSSTVGARSVVRITYDVLFIDRNETGLDLLQTRLTTNREQFLLHCKKKEAAALDKKEKKDDRAVPLLRRLDVRHAEEDDGGVIVTPPPSRAGRKLIEESLPQSGSLLLHQGVSRR